MNKTPYEIIMSIKPFGATCIYPPDVYPAGGYTRHRYITSIWRHTDGSYEINGSAGHIRYMFYSKREAIRNYNQLAKASRT